MDRLRVPRLLGSSESHAAMYVLRTVGIATVLSGVEIEVKAIAALNIPEMIMGIWGIGVGVRLARIQNRASYPTEAPPTIEDLG